MKRPWLLLPRACTLATVYSAAACSVAACSATVYLATACLAAPVWAADSADATDATDAADGWEPVAEHVLADARGGFESGNGLLVSLSVDRVLSLNGNVVASGQLSIDAPALAGQSVPSTLQIARIGEGSAMVQAARPLSGLVLQNSANDQLIRSQTTIDATVNSLSILKDMHFGDSLHQALSTAILPR